MKIKRLMYDWEELYKLTHAVGGVLNFIVIHFTHK